MSSSPKRPRHAGPLLSPLPSRLHPQERVTRRKTSHRLRKGSRKRVFFSCFCSSYLFIFRIYIYLFKPQLVKEIKRIVKHKLIVFCFFFFFTIDHTNNSPHARSHSLFACDKNEDKTHHDKIKQHSPLYFSPPKRITPAGVMGMDEGERRLYPKKERCSAKEFVPTIEN